MAGRSERVLDYINEEPARPGYIHFSQTDMEPGCETDLYLPIEDWEQIFDSASVITITIVTGDRLNPVAGTPEAQAAAGVTVTSFDRKPEDWT